MVIISGVPIFRIFTVAKILIVIEMIETHLNNSAVASAIDFRH